MDTVTVEIVSPTSLAALHGRKVELTVELPRGYATVELHHREDGNEAWGMPTITTITVAGERWCDGMDDDGDGIPVATVGELAILLGCEPKDVATVLREEYWNHSLPSE